VKKIISEQELLDFAEGLPLSPETEKMLISMLSGSAEFRLDMEQYRRDLARVDSEIPNFPLTLELAQLLPNLVLTAIKNRYQKELVPEKFFRSREIVIVVGFLVSMLAMVAAYLWIWKKN
jgi:hypothetical protein